MNNRWARILLVILLFVAFSAFLSLISGLVKIIILSALLAFILDPVARFFESRGMSRDAATLLIFSLLITLSIIMVVFIVPVFFSEIDGIQGGLSSQQLLLTVSALEQGLESQLAFLGTERLHLVERVQSVSSSLAQWMVDHVLDLATIVINVILVPFITFFLLKDGRTFKKNLVGMVPNRYFEAVLHWLHNMEVQVSNFLLGQVLDAVIVGILSTVALWVIGVKYFLVIGIIAGFSNLIPLFGPLVGATVAILLALLSSASGAMIISIIIAFIAVKLLDDALVQPLVVGKTVHLHPLIVLLVIIIGGKFFGVLGMFLAVPAAGFLKVVVQESLSNYRRYRVS